MAGIVAACEEPDNLSVYLLIFEIEYFEHILPNCQLLFLENGVNAYHNLASSTDSKIVVSYQYFFAFGHRECLFVLFVFLLHLYRLHLLLLLS